MTYPTDHAGLEVLPFDMCLELLASVPVGRIGFFADGALVILPVNHLVDGQDVVFRTAAGSKLSAAENGDLMVFEADSYDDLDRSGWSVVVNGSAEVIDDDAETGRLSSLGLHPWITAVKHPFWIRIRPVSVSGRRTPGALAVAHDTDSRVTE
jgi:nitroimidazol reductase NimA-like FMN-containing flavoprotein (pyridoxamine 5'-phosphate oxidase superfamily)